MARKRRKGSSTRRYKIPSSRPKHKQETKVKAPEVAPTADKQRELIAQMEEQIRSGVNKQGQPLTDKEISVYLSAISGLEHSLGIKHYQ